MNEKGIKMFMSHLGIDNAELHNDWVRSSCPLAFHRHKAGKDSNPSFGVYNNPTGQSGFNCFSCNVKGRNLEALVMEISFALTQVSNPPDIKLAEAMAMLEDEINVGYSASDWTGKISMETKEFEEWPLWYLDSFDPVSKHPVAMAYLNSRGVSPKLWQELDIRFDTDKGTVCFPFYNRAKKLAGLRGRLLKAQGHFRYLDYKWNNTNNTALVWLGEHHIDYLKPVVVVEGQFDYANVYAVYPNVMANFSTGLNETKVSKLDSAVEVIGFFDDDEAGAIASELLRHRLWGMYQSVNYAAITGIGSGATRIKDPGGMTHQQIAQALSPFVNIAPF